MYLTCNREHDARLLLAPTAVIAPFATFFSAKGAKAANRAKVVFDMQPTARRKTSLGAKGGHGSLERFFSAKAAKHAKHAKDVFDVQPGARPKFHGGHGAIRNVI
jgi:hypothetical protein